MGVVEWLGYDMWNFLPVSSGDECILEKGLCGSAARMRIEMTFLEENEKIRLRCIHTYVRMYFNTLIIIIILKNRIVGGESER